MQRSKDPEQQARDAQDSAPSRTLRILAQLRGEDPKALLQGYDDQQDPELTGQVPMDPNAPPGSVPDQPSQVGPGLARVRAPAGLYRGTSPKTRR
jgi:hypothetical protein